PESGEPGAIFAGPAGPASSAGAPLRPAQGLEAAPVLLRRPGTQVGAGRPGQPPFCGMPLAGGEGIRGLLVERRGDARRAAALGDARDHDRPPHFADPHLDDVGGAHVLRRLHALAVDPDVAPGDGVGREAAGLEEPRRPEPLVDANCLHSYSRLLPPPYPRRPPTPGS